MHGIVLSPEVWTSLLVAFALAPLLPLRCLRFVQDAARRSLLASFIFFLPMLLMTRLYTLTRESDGSSCLAMFSVGLFMLLSVWAAFAGVLSLRRGVECVGTYRFALLWMVPEALVCLWISFLLLRLLLDRILLPV